MASIFEIRHLEVVEAIHRTGSITRAAAYLNLSQPAVSHSLRQIENRLSVQLFVRQPRGLAVTASGERIVSSARSVLGELRVVEQELREGSVGETGTLRLTTECYTCYYWLPAVLAELRNRYPGLQLVVSTEATHRPLEALLADEVDVAIVHTHVAHEELALTPLFSNEVVALVHPGDPLAKKRFLKAEDFRDQHVVLHYEPLKSVLFTEVLSPAGIEPERVTEIRLTEAVVEMAKAGLGISVMARWAAAPQLADGSLCAIPLTRRGIARDWWACRKRACVGHAGCEELVKLLREHGGRTSWKIPQGGR